MLCLGRTPRGQSENLEGGPLQTPKGKLTGVDGINFSSYLQKDPEALEEPINYDWQTLAIE